ncbi:cytoskeleton assembly control protein SLA1p [Neurospora tetrasperma FGSC 2508]|uniref:Actin cytoskeleton-regulatory complex protein SLA1 n=1 Tax=Neurospora tetrasperma (strain FGSC 2508 / ATCC MYA-4615 / P0657) TaxID=510951 RepID=F8N385_NEUT8|nr:cytoskeleton assembly control protein SLA1p [Neurospora tetrasperma FGSC 2508]EGO53392.1 cytoskeleton assembly control protein SLA1p [Neurospora tetrasperma FGSC 2508]
MGFLGVYRAIYDYTPQGEGELTISEGDILYVLEKSQEDDWWKAKKKANAADDDEPVGLIPNNYIEEAKPVSYARALYEYTRQTDEELSFPEDAQLSVFDTSDPDWILVGHDGNYGFAPANYIELGDGQAGQVEEEEEATAPPPPLPQRTPSVSVDVASPPLPARSVPSEPSTPVAASNPAAAAIAGVMANRSSFQPPAPISVPLPQRQSYASEDYENEVRSPPLPSRPRGDSQIAPEQKSYRPVPPPAQSAAHDTDDYGISPRTSQAPPPQTAALTPGGFHMYNINEMTSVMGKKKKMPTTLGINLRTGMILIAPEHSHDGPSQEWRADCMTHYSREGKHVFMELVRPSKSVDFHAGAKDTAEEIVAMLGDMAGTVRLEGLKEIIAAGAGGKKKKGAVLYDFMAQGEDEVTVGVGDEVVILDDTKSDEWWMVRRIKNGKEGVVPSSYIEINGVWEEPETAISGIAVGMSEVEKNRLEEARLTKEAIKAAQREEEKEKQKRNSEVGPGLQLQERSSSLPATDDNRRGKQRSSRREPGQSNSSKSSSKSKPDPSKVRTWTDRSKSFSVEAQFLGVKDGKIRLHKMNGVQIAVPVSKMSVEDLEYVERVTGESLDEDKPLSDLRNKRSAGESSRSSRSTRDRERDRGSSSRVGATIDSSKKPDYDWFNFFLGCDIQVGLCERYSQAFLREAIDESVLPDVDATVLRNLGLREGDIIKVMRYLDNKYMRNKKGEEGEGGLFSGPGGALRNNTKKGRPAPPVEVSNTVDPNAFSKDSGASSGKSSSPTAAATPTPSASKPSSGFDDDAWDVKPTKTKTPELAAQAVAPAPAAAPAAAPAPAAPALVDAPAPPPPAALTKSMQELSLLTQPLEPEKVAPPPVVQPAITLPPPSAAPAAAAAPAQVPQLTGATPGFFTGMQPPAVGAQILPQNIARQRPLAPQFTAAPGGLVAPPPSRPLSAPQSAQPSAFTPPPIQPQMTGFQAPQIAPPGQSLGDLAQQRLQQQYAAQMQAQQQQMQQPMMTGMQPMMTGMQPQQTGFGQFPPQQQPFMPQPTGFGMQQQQQQPMMTGMQPQQTGFGQFPQQQPQPFMPQPTGYNHVGGGLPPPLQPQATGMSFTQGFGNGPQQQHQPLVPQQTGPAPPVRFGISGDAKKLAPQATGRRANLAAATPDNPFGF